MIPQADGKRRMESFTWSQPKEQANRRTGIRTSQHKSIWAKEYKNFMVFRNFGSYNVKNSNQHEGASRDSSVTVAIHWIVSRLWIPEAKCNPINFQLDSRLPGKPHQRLVFAKEPCQRLFGQMASSKCTLWTNWTFSKSSELKAKVGDMKFTWTEIVYDVSFSRLYRKPRS